MTNAISHDQSARLILLASRASVGVAIFLLLIKLYGWIMTGSVSILAAFMDSLIDLAASVINLLAVRWAFVPPDEEHRFGHGKAESLAGLGQSVFIFSSAIFLILSASERLFNPKLIESVELGSAIILVSLAVTAVLMTFQRYVVARTGSLAIKADSLHYTSDVLGYLGIGTALILEQQGYFYADPIVALLIGLYIGKSAWRIGYEAVQHLMDRELPESERQRVFELARASEGVLEVHGLRTRLSGHTRIIQLHLVFDGRLSLLEAHRLTEQVEKKLRAEFSHADVLIHQDPHTEAVKPLEIRPTGATKSLDEQP